MARPLRPFVDRILNGTLDERLSERRARGETYEQIARWLEREHQISVTSETVRVWCAEMAAEKAS